VSSIRDETVEGGRWFDVNWNLLPLGYLDEIAKLSIGPQDQDTLERTRAGA
jgi:hypothetical protein